MFDKIFGKKKEQKLQPLSPEQLDIEEFKAFQQFKAAQRYLQEQQAPKHEEPAPVAKEDNVTSRVIHLMSGENIGTQRTTRKRRVIQPKEEVATEETTEEDLSGLGERVKIMRQKAKDMASSMKSKEDFKDEEQGTGSITDTEGKLMLAQDLMHPKDKDLDIMTITPPHFMQPAVIVTSVNEMEPIVVMPRVIDTARSDYVNWLKRTADSSNYSEDMKTWIQTHGINIEELEKEVKAEETIALQFDPSKIDVSTLPYYTMSTKNGAKNTGVDIFIRRHDRRMMSFKGESQKNALEIMEIKSGQQEDEALRSSKKGW
jgi:hypothetical protein